MYLNLKNHSELKLLLKTKTSIVCKFSNVFTKLISNLEHALDKERIQYLKQSKVDKMPKIMLEIQRGRTTPLMGSNKDPQGRRTTPLRGRPLCEGWIEDPFCKGVQDPSAEGSKIPLQRGHPSSEGSMTTPLLRGCLRPLGSNSAPFTAEFGPTQRPIQALKKNYKQKSRRKMSDYFGQSKKSNEE